MPDTLPISSPATPLSEWGKGVGLAILWSVVVFGILNNPLNWLLTSVLQSPAIVMAAFMVERLLFHVVIPVFLYQKMKERYAFAKPFLISALVLGAFQVLQVLWLLFYLSSINQS